MSINNIVKDIEAQLDVIKLEQNLIEWLEKQKSTSNKDIKREEDKVISNNKNTVIEENTVSNDIEISKQDILVLPSETISIEISKEKKKKDIKQDDKKKKTKKVISKLTKPGSKLKD